MYTNLKKQGVIILAALAVILGLVAYAGTIFFKETLTDKIPDVTPQNSSAIVQIDFSNGEKRAFESELDGGVYPFNIALQSVAEAGGFALSIKGTLVEEIAGSGGPWKIYKNGTIVNSATNSLTITGGDYYVLKRE